MSGTVHPNGYSYVSIGRNANNVVLGTVGGPGNYLHRILIVANATTTAGVTLQDGPLGPPLPLLGLGVPAGSYDLELGIASVNGPWILTTGPNVTAIAIGLFPPPSAIV